MSQFRSYLPFLVIWTLVNLLQAACTELLHDEAYYWVYAQNMAWGYFDHPPAIATSIWLGTHLLAGELGVRLVHVLLSTGIMWALFHWVQPSRRTLFFAFVCSIALVHLGFLAVPDIPLIAGACIFMIFFERYLEKDSWYTALMLALAAATMMYAKYHGALLILLAFLSQFHLLRRKTFWGLTAVALLLYLPHLGWLVDHDLMTLRYHLFERAGAGFAWQYPVEYVLGQLVLFGPVTGVVVLLSWREWERGGMARTSRWIVVGVFGIFLLNSFRGRVEANWTAIALPALIYLSYRAIEARPDLARLVRVVAAISIPLLLVVRIMLVADLSRAAKLEEIHGWKQWANEVREAADGRIPVFRNSYQYASKYAFYAGLRSFSCNDAANKGNQYDLLHAYEDGLQDQPVLFLSRAHADSIWDTHLPALHTETGQMHRRLFNAFKSYNRLDIRLADPPVSCSSGEQLHLRLLVANSTSDDILIDTANASLSACFQQHGVDSLWWVSAPLTFTRVGAGSQLQTEVNLPLALPPARYTYRVGVRWNETGGKNGFKHHLEVTRGR